MGKSQVIYYRGRIQRHPQELTLAGGHTVVGLQYSIDRVNSSFQPRVSSVPRPRSFRSTGDSSLCDLQVDGDQQ